MITVMEKLKRMYCLSCKASTFHRGTTCSVCGKSKFVTLGRAA